MSKIIQLEWKQFSIDLDKNNKRFKIILSSNYDGLVATEENLSIYFINDYSQEDHDTIVDYWNNLTEQVENTPTQEEAVEYVKNLVMGAVTFGQNLIIEFASQNVAMGITQQGKTAEVLSIMEEKIEVDPQNKPGIKVSVIGTIQSGSLYECIHAINYHIDKADNGDYDSLSPFITPERLTDFKNKILSYLNG